MKNCGRCHECGVELEKHLDGEEWCPSCKQYRRYKSHGWGHGGGEWNCLEIPAIECCRDCGQPWQETETALGGDKPVGCQCKK